jgi:hypothetical protein
MFVVKDAVREPLYAVVPYFNPWRWKSREKHTLRALKHFSDSGVVIVLVEAAFNRREFTLADSGLHDSPANCNIHGEGKFRHIYIPLRTKDELWLKENLINVAVSRLPHDWEQLCWLDSDVHFVRPNWVGECIHKLQHFAFLQMFSQARDLAPNSEMMPEDYPHANGVSFLKSWREGTIEEDLAGGAKNKKKLSEDEGGYYGRRVFPGLAWAATRKAFDSVGGLIDFAIWGGADWHMAHALIDKTDSMMHTKLHPNYQGMVRAWHEKCQKHIRQNVGVMEGAIFHAWHGKKTVRGYGDKHRILANLGFDPVRHLKRDYQGLWQLHDDGTPAFIGLRDSMRRIAHERNEDSIDV